MKKESAHKPSVHYSPILYFTFNISNRLAATVDDEDPVKLGPQSSTADAKRESLQAATPDA
jgi:hypothetical protein